MRRPERALLLLALVNATACTSNYEGRFRASHHSNFIANCSARFRSTAVERYAPSYCECVADGVVGSFNSAQLIALGFHIAPEPVQRRSDAIVHACSARAVSIVGHAADR